MIPAARLGRRCQASGGVSFQGLDHKARAKGRQLVVQLAGRGVGADRHRFGEQDRSRVNLLLDAHDGDPGLAVAGQDGALDGRRAAPARQQRGMDVDAAEPGRIEDGVGQNKAVGGDHGGIGAQRRDRGLLVGALQTHRRAHVQAPLLGAYLHRRRPEPLAAPGPPGRLAIDGGNVVAGIDEGVQDRAPRNRAFP